MQITLFNVALFNFMDAILISFFGMRLVVKAFENFALEYKIKRSEEEYRKYGSFDIFMDNLNYVRRHFWISFYILEFALISYFLFWGILFYYQANII